MIPSFKTISEINAFLESPLQTDDLVMVLREDQQKFLVETIRVHILENKKEGPGKSAAKTKA